MTPSETAELLGTIQAFDRRTVGEADIMAWHVTLVDIELDPARKAVLAHFTAGKEWLMPSDIRTAVLGERRRMVAAIPAVVPPWQLADLPADEQRWVADYRHAIADGLPDGPARIRANHLAGITEEEPLAIEAGEMPSLRESLDRAERDRRDEVRMREIQAEVARRAKADEKAARRAAIDAAAAEAQRQTTAAREAVVKARQAGTVDEVLGRHQTEQNETKETVA